MSAGRSRQWFICQDCGWRGRSYDLPEHRKVHRERGDGPPEWLVLTNEEMDDALRDMHEDGL
jgi:hypothetical protein